jgi:hypothetical protein
VAIVAWIGFIRKPRRTRAGDEVLEEAFATYRGIDQPAEEEVKESPRPADTLALSVGLFGTTLLAGTALDMLHRSWPQSSGWSSGGCGSDGGGCGGGGCGGGGCGGCGGD